MAGRRTKRQIMADEYARKVVSERNSRKRKSDNPDTIDDDGLLEGLIPETEPEGQDLKKAFVGRMERTRVYDDFVEQYAQSRGSQYDLINRQIETMYDTFVIKGGWDVGKLLTILIVLFKSGADINRWQVSKFGAIYDKGNMPIGALKGVSKKDFDFIADDASKTGR